MRFTLFLITGIFCLEAYASNAAVGSSIDCSKTFSLNKSIWTREEPIMISSVDDEDLPLTFSFDAEIGHAEVMRFLQSDPVALKKLSDAAAKLKNSKGDPFKGFTLSELAMSLAQSKKQVLSFALRKGTDKAKPLFQLEDLNPSAFEVMMAVLLRNIVKEDQRIKRVPRALVMDSSSSLEFLKTYQDLLLNFARSNNLPIKSTLEGHLPEFQHSSFETSPKKFFELIKNKLQKTFPRAQTHLHIGIPEHVSKERAALIARAVESRIILRMAGDSPLDTKSLYADGYRLDDRGFGYESTLRSKVEESGKRVGIIRLNFNNFYDKATEIYSHDLEVRQWTKIDDALYNIELASKMAMERKRILVVEDFAPVDIPDLVTGNLNGALSYVGLLLTNHSDVSFQRIGADLLGFSKRIESEGAISSEVRKEIYLYLRKNEVLKKLDESVFLKPGS